MALHRLSVSLNGGAKHGAKPQSTHPPVDMPTQYGTCPCLPCYYVRIITVPTIRADRPSKYAKRFVSFNNP